MSMLTPRLLPRLLVLTLTVTLAACNTAQTHLPSRVKVAAIAPHDAAQYGAIIDDRYPVPAVEPERLKRRNVRQLVDLPTTEKPGTVVIDPQARYLYLVQEHGKALRYGVGVGREGMEFKGTATVNRKAQWPRWTPTPDMIKREPARYKRWAGGMEGGAHNPLGARALYLFKNGKDTLYRIHGTNEPDSIGQAVSSGCIRMMNQDVIDLYSRVPAGSKVVVL
jgi:lipoprotein-anchoring transpeptidase ErfK/SrfK